MFKEKVKEDDIYLIFGHFKIRTIFIDRPTDRQTGIVVHREVTLPKRKLKFGL